MEIKKNMKSDFDEFLKEESIFEEVNNNAIKRVIAYQIEQEMKQQNITQTELAKKMNTSRTVIHKLLNPENLSSAKTVLISSCILFASSLLTPFSCMPSGSINNIGLLAQ